MSARVISGQTITGESPLLAAVTPIADKMLRCRECPLSARTRQSTAQSKLSFEGPASAEARGCWCGQSGNWAIAKIALIKAASRTIFSIAHIHASLLPERTIGSVWLAQNVKRGCRQNLSLIHISEPT